MVKKYGPELGPLYYEKSNAWEAALKLRQSSETDLAEICRSVSGVLQEDKKEK